MYPIILSKGCIKKLMFKEEIWHMQLYNPLLSGKSSKDTENTYSIQVYVE